MGSFEQVPALPKETQIGYVEGYLDALARIKAIHTRQPEMSIEYLCFVLEVSMRTYLLSGDVVALPDDLSHFPTVAKLLNTLS